MSFVVFILIIIGILTVLAGIAGYIFGVIHRIRHNVPKPWKIQ